MRPVSPDLLKKKDEVIRPMSPDCLRRKIKPHVQRPFGIRNLTQRMLPSGVLTRSDGI